MRYGVFKKEIMSFFRYPGGKSKLRNVIIDKLLCDSRQYKEYREPFFGGGSIGIGFMSDLNCGIKNFWFNDKDIGISCLWFAVMNHHELLKDKINAFTPKVDDFYAIKSYLLNEYKIPIQTDDIVDLGFKKLVIHQISYSGLGVKSGGPLGGSKQKSKYKIDCRWSPKYICQKIDKLHNQFLNLNIKHNTCSNFDFVDTIEDESCKSLIYLDPPYYEKGNELYQCSFTDDDHLRLSNALRATNHDWLLSYDDCSEIRSLYKWAKIEELSVNYSINAVKNKQTGAKSCTVKTELMISNKDLSIDGSLV